jgi:hypothetical protein
VFTRSFFHPNDPHLDRSGSQFHHELRSEEIRFCCQPTNPLFSIIARTDATSIDTGTLVSLQLSISCLQKTPVSRHPKRDFVRHTQQA